MEYEVKVAEIRTVRKETAKQIESWLSKIETVGTACTGMMEVKGLQGEMAESIKSYIKDIHLSFLVGITQMLSEYKDRLYIYESGYDKIDGAVKAHITQEVLEEQSTKIEINKEDFLEIVAKLQGALDDVADIFGASAPSTRRICNSFDDLKEKTQKLKEDVGNYEYQHETDCEGVKEQINSIKALIKSLNKGSQINIKSYKAGSILTNLDFQKLQKAYVSSTSYYEGNRESIQQAKDSIDTKEALAEARIQKGAWDIAAAIGTGLIVVASVAAIVASGGTATPLVMIALGSTIAYGASNVYEASEDIQYGLAGDIESVSLNPIQDTVFLGNEVAYDTWGMISAGISLGACTPMGSTQKVTAEGIKQAITKFLGSGASNIAKQSISFGGKSLLVAGSGMVTEALVTPYTSEDAGRLMGLMSGAFVASKVFGVKPVESKQKVEYSAFGEMSETDGIRYTEWNYEKIREMSIKNPNSKSMTLGKYFTDSDGNVLPKAYTEMAKQTGDTYFDLGSKWDEIKKAYNLTDNEMFELFNVSALDDAVSKGKTIRFSQDPRAYGDCALKNEWEYLKNKYNYKQLKQIGDYWYAK